MEHNILPANHGLTVLDIQEQIMEALLDCCFRILDTSVEVDLFDKQVPVLPEPPEISPDVDNLTKASSLSAIVLEAPYRTPRTLDLHRLKALFFAKLSAAEDHLTFLREDPGYFSACLEARKEHRKEMMLDEAGRKHALFRLNREDQLWAKVLQSELSDAFHEIELWSDVVQNTDALFQVHQLIGHRIGGCAETRRLYLNVLVGFQHRLVRMTRYMVSKLQVSFPFSPLTRHFYFLYRLPGTSDHHVVANPTQDQPEALKTLYWYIAQFRPVADVLFPRETVTIMDELERFVQSNKDARVLITPYVANIMGDISIIAEGLRHTHNYHPWIQMAQIHSVDRRENVNKQWLQANQRFSYFKNMVTGHPRETDLVRLCDPSNHRFHHPVDQRWTQATVDAVAKAEANLHAFWTAFDECWSPNVEKFKDTALQSILDKTVLVRRFVPHSIDPSKSETAETADAAQPLCQHLRDLFHGIERDSDSQISSPRAPSSIFEDTVIPYPIPDSIFPPRNSLGDPGIWPRYAVDARALKVFHALFHVPSSGTFPSQEISWPDFVHALNVVGLRAEKLYGSAWVFEAVDPCARLEGSLLFHEPWPSGRLPYATLRRYGRRLRLMFRWHRRTFQRALKTTGLIPSFVADYYR